MNAREEKKPLFVLAIEGMGFSNSWQGNAIMTASMKNFENLWAATGSQLLKSPAESLGLTEFQCDPAVAYAIIGNGQKLPKFKTFLDGHLEKGLTFQNKNYLDFITSVKTNNSALHLIGTLSKQSEVGDKDQLIHLVEAAKSKDIFRVYIHLLVDDTHNKEELSAFLDQFEHQLSELGVGEIATISGAACINNEKSAERLFAAIFDGKARRYLSGKQAANNIDTEQLSECEPMLIANLKGRIINDFDGILFFNHNILATDQLLIELFKSSNYRRRKFVKSLTLLDNYYSNFTGIPSIYTRKNLKKLCQVLREENKKSLFIFDKKNEDKLSYYLLDDSVAKLAVPPCTGANFVKSCEMSLANTLKAGIKAFDSGKFDLIFSCLSYIPEAFQSKGFGTGVDVLKLIDYYLLLAVKEVTNRDGQILLFSPYGMAEKYTGNLSSRNPLPYSLLTKDLLQGSNKKELKKLREISLPKDGLEVIYNLIVNNV